MRNFFKFVTPILLVFAVASLAAAADIQGILVDRHCSAKIAQQGQKAAQAHTLECSLMPDCVKAGYAVYTADSKLLILDSAGNKTAEAALRASQKKNDLRVQISGVVTGDNLKVATLKLLP
jgi:Tfp pilus assembly ATPase PilU